MRSIVLALLLVVFQAPATSPDRLRAATAAIAQGADTAERRAAIVENLKTIGVDYHIEGFTLGTYAGSNIVAEIPAAAGSETLLLGAHYDRVERGRGAVDNAASCAVLLDLMEHLRSKPLTHTAVTTVFFDLEEKGLVGSRSYLQIHAASGLPAHAMNFDIFGYGDTLFVTPSRADSPLLAMLMRAASEAGFPMRWFPMSQYPSSDHQAMARAGIDTLGVTLIDGAEIDSIITPGPVRPRILAMIHTDADSMEQIREQDMAKAEPIVERTIRLLDASEGR